MPHIPKSKRDCTPSFERPADDVGELTFQLTCVLQHYIVNHQPLRFQVIAECKGALGEAYDDLVREVGNPYEFRKAGENGNVWTSLRIAGLL